MIAAIGLVLLFAGLVVGGWLWVLADREPENKVESFGRAEPGCITTLTFEDAGEFYVYEELSGVQGIAVEGCEPSVLPGRAFTVVVTKLNGEEVPLIEDTSISYDLDAGQATSIARIVLDVPGEYFVRVQGNDPAVVAAIGGDPEADVERYRRAAIAAAAAGVVFGGLLLWLSGRRSKRAATFAGPLDPGWGVTERDHQRRAAAAAGTDFPAPPVTGQVPVNPHAPDERRVAQLDTDPSTWNSPPAPPAPTRTSPEPEAAPTLFEWADTESLESEPVEAQPVESQPVESQPVESQPVESMEAAPVAGEDAGDAIDEPVMPVAAPVPDEPERDDAERDEPERDDAGGTSSGDDTPPA